MQDESESLDQQHWRSHEIKKKYLQIKPYGVTNVLKYKHATSTSLQKRLAQQRRAKIIYTDQVSEKVQKLDPQKGTALQGAYNLLI